MPDSAPLTYHPWIDYDGPDFALFCSHLSARLCVVDFLYKTRELKQEGYDPHAPATLILPIQYPIAMQPLFDSDYATLIIEACRRMSITSHAADSFRSELDDDLYKMFVAGMALQGRQVAVEADPARSAFLVTLPDFISDLILPPLSQLHTAIVENCRHHAELIQAVGGDPTRLFLNARESSVFSMFILTWVASRLGVPLTYGDPNSIVAVI